VGEGHFSDDNFGSVDGCCVELFSALPRGWRGWVALLPLDALSRSLPPLRIVRAGGDTTDAEAALRQRLRAILAETGERRQRLAPLLGHP